jgi:hypothetical protein
LTTSADFGSVSAMEFRVPQHLSHPVESVFAAYRDRLVDLVPYLDEIESIEVVERREDGGKTYITNRWRAKSATVPVVVRPFFPKNALAWLDRAVWDPAARTCSWEYELGTAPGLVRCSGVNYFRPRDGGSTLEIVGNLQVDLKAIHVPAIFRGAGPHVESYVVGRVRPNLERVGPAVERWLKDRG